ncbi:MAG: hypothetical protein M5F18_12925 [Asgard group archaeon]|nr:hypothetical protein [Asgard group archaeon]
MTDSLCVATTINNATDTYEEANRKPLSTSAVTLYLSILPILLLVIIIL